MREVHLFLDVDSSQGAAFAGALRASGFRLALADDHALVRISTNDDVVTITLRGTPPIHLPRSTSPGELARVARLLVDHGELTRRLRDAAPAASTSLVSQMLLHDANNVLTLIFTLLDVVPADREDSLENHALLAEASQKLARILRRLGAHQRTPNPVRNISLSVAVSALLPHLRLLVPDRSIEVRVASDLPHVSVDPVDLERSIVNLVKNAGEATAPKGRILIAAESLALDDETKAVRVGTWVDLSVEDDGVGMPAPTLLRATEPFFTTKGADGGSGLGLASVARMVRDAGGRLKIVSVPGVGTSVHLLLPASDILDETPATGTGGP